MSFPEFRAFLADALGVAETDLKPEARLFLDLHVDSLRILELVAKLEKLLEAELPSDLAWEIRTVDDAYRFTVNYLRDRTS
jgi:acyl carrier protein